MRIEKIDPNKVHLADYNPREISNHAFKGLIESIKTFGFQQPIIINKRTNTLISGHQRIKAAIELRLKDVPVIYVDLSEIEEKAFNITMNNKSIEGEFTEELRKLMQEIENGLGADFIFDLNMDALLKDLPKDIEFEEDNGEKELKTLGILSDHFIVPPFSTLDARCGAWQDRKKIWKELINDNGQARAHATCMSKRVIAGLDSVHNGGVSLLDPVLSEILVKWFSPYENSKIFDCFAGDTVFGFVALNKGHTFTGIELRQEQADFNNNLCPNAYICDDGRNIKKHIAIGSQDLFFSCPPYFNLEVYSDLENDASNQPSYDAFYKILDEAFKESIDCLAENRFAVIVCGDIRDKKGRYYDFTSSIKKTFKEAGLCLYNELILLDPLGTACVRARRYMRNRKVAKVHQNVLVFFKGDTQKISSIYPILKGEENNGSEDAEFSDMD